MVIPEAADISLQRGVRNIRGIAAAFLSFFLSSSLSSMILRLREEEEKEEEKEEDCVLNEVDQWTEGGKSRNEVKRVSDGGRGGREGRQRWTTGDVLDVLSLSS